MTKRPTAAKSRQKSTTKAKPATPATVPPCDTDLINECVIYAQSIAAWRAGFRADPDGDNKYAEPLGEQHDLRAQEALKKITATRATTPEGLCAKAQIAPLIFEHAAGSHLDEEEAALLRAFANEVQQFLEPICDGRLKVEKAARAQDTAPAD